MKRDISTTDIVYAATLKISGYSLDKIEKQSNRGTFFFSDVDDEFANHYSLDQIRVSPQQLNDAVKALTTSVRRVINL